MGREEIGTITGISAGTDSGDAEADLQAHINSPTPHPAYDDNLNLIIYFQNGLA